MTIGNQIVLEQKAIISDLTTYLATKGWSNLTYTDGWNEMDISNPLVNIYVIDNGPKSLGLGKTSERLYDRILQIDVFMENEDRVQAILQDLVEWMDRSITIYDLDSAVIGSFTCVMDESIATSISPPELNNPEILRWRGIVRGDFEAHYPEG